MRSRSDPGLPGQIVSVHPFRLISGELNFWLRDLSVIFEEDHVFVLTSSSFILGPNHIASAFYHASKAWINSTARAKDPSIEVLRWLTGSKQVRRALEVSAHGETGSYMLLMTMPNDAFHNRSSPSLPEVVVEMWEGPRIEGLEPLGPDDPMVWGGPDIRKVLEIEESVEEEFIELAVLEKVASIDL